MGGGGGRGGGLVAQVVATAADGDDEGDEVGDPAPALVEVHGFEAEERDGEGDEGGHDDADGDADFFGVDGCEGLAADDGGDEAEAGDGGGVEEEGDGDEVFPGRELGWGWREGRAGMAYPKEYRAWTSWRRPVLAPAMPMKAGGMQVSMAKKRMTRDASLRLMPNDRVASRPVGRLGAGSVFLMVLFMWVGNLTAAGSRDR